MVTALAVLLWAVVPTSHAQKKNNRKKAEPAAAPAPTAPIPIAPAPTGITFEGLEMSFGKIKQGELVKHTFRFVNNTGASLSIVSVKPSCGCTTPSFTSNPVKPGQTGEIAVVFNSSGKLGPQHKAVVVTFNTEPAIYTLLLQGEVFSDILP